MIRKARTVGDAKAEPQWSPKPDLLLHIDTSDQEVILMHLWRMFEI